MTVFVIRRIGLMLAQLLFVVCGVFVLLRILPADPVAQLTGRFASPEQVAAVEQQLGLDQSVLSQLGDYLGGLFRGDLGTSWYDGVSVWSAVWGRFPLTFELVVLSLGLALALALVVGSAAAAREGRRFDRYVLNFTLFSSAQPSFFWALVAIFVFYTTLDIAPAPLGVMSIGTSPPPSVTGFIIVDCVLDGNFAALGDVLAHFAIPVLLLALLLSGPLIKMTRQGVVQAGRSEHMLYARICGLSTRTSRSYLLRNSLAPVVTLTGVLFAGALSGIVFIESIFSFPGLARYTLESTKRLDFPAIQGCVLLLTFFALLMYLIMDLVYAALDPRIVYGKDNR